MMEVDNSENMEGNENAVNKEKFFPVINNRLLSSFTPLKKSVGLHSKHIVRVKPTRDIGEKDEEISFKIPYSTTNWLDLQNADVVIRGRLKKADGTKLTEDDKVVLAPNTYCALFSHVKILVGKEDTEITDYSFPYKGLLQSIIFHQNERVSVASLSGASFPPMTSESDFADQSERAAQVKLSKLVEIISPTYISLFSTYSYVPPALDMKITFRRSSDLFYLIQSPEVAVNNYIFVIEDMQIRIPAIRIMPEIGTHLEHLRTSVNPILHYDNYMVKKLTINAGIQTQTFSGLFAGNLPKLLFVSLVNEDNFVGKKTLNPFFTSGEEIEKITLMTNGTIARSFKVDLKSGIYSDAYKAFVEALGAANKAFSISYAAYGSGNCFFAFDFLNCEPPLNGEACNAEMLHQGTMDLEFVFKSTTTKSLVALIFYLTTDSVQILKTGTAVLNRVVV